MQRYVKLYSDVLKPEICKEMIDLFDANPAQQQPFVDKVMDFKQINLFQHKDVWQKHIDTIVQLFLAGVKQYKDECKIKDLVQWPENYGFEEFRMKRYEPNQGRFDLHTDVNNMKSAKRFLAFFIYLNSGDDGGTRFPDLDIDVPRIEGSMLMFPPLWTYPHIGLMPLKAPKYIIGSYLHYLED
jgi:hypothetical protein